MAFKGVQKQLQNATKGAPRRMPDYKYWMSHVDHKEEFRDEYETMMQDDPPEGKNRVAKMCEVAEELYKVQPEDVKAQIAEENEEQYSARRLAFKNLMSGSGFSLEELGNLDEETMKLSVYLLFSCFEQLFDDGSPHSVAVETSQSSYSLFLTRLEHIRVYG